MKANSGSYAVSRPPSWDVTAEEARQLQNELRTQVVGTDRFGKINTVAGADIGFKKDIARASVVVLSFPELQVVESVVTESPVRFPYIPGLLSFREIPPLLTAFTQLQTEPDLVIVDGQGIAHPRRFGLASHLGLVLDKPAIGCANPGFGTIRGTGIGTGILHVPDG